MADVSAKKRKRTSNGVETPSKKTTAHLAAAGNISISHLHGEGLHPVIAVSNGVTPPAIKFDAYMKPLSARQVDKVGDPSSHGILLHSSKHTRLDYTATPTTSDGLAHYVAAFDPSTNSLKIVPVHHTRLHAVLRTEPPSVQATPRKTIYEQRNDLGQEFGTKKAKIAISSRTVNSIVNVGAKSEDVQNAILDDVAAQTGLAISAQEKLKATLASKPIPQPNLAAKTVEEVYPLDKLIPPSDMRLIPIDDWLEQAKDKKIGVQGYNRFSMHRVKTLIDKGDMKKLRVLRYVSLMLQFNDALVKGPHGVKKVPKREELLKRVVGYPNSLVDSIRKRFGGEKGELNKFQLEMLYTHICALALFVDDYSTEISNLRDDLRLETKVIAQLFVELSCKVTLLSEKEKEARRVNKALAATMRMAKLKLPLDFPKPRSGRSR